MGGGAKHKTNQKKHLNKHKLQKYNKKQKTNEKKANTQQHLMFVYKQKT